MPDDLDQLVSALSALGDPREFEVPVPYKGIALSILDSIWSMGVRYKGVENVLGRYRSLRNADGQVADVDTAEDLVEAIEKLGGPEAFAEAVNNRQRTAPRGGILKAEAVFNEAFLLSRTAYVTPTELAAASAKEIEEIAKGWAGVKGQKSQISWKYFLMLTGVPGVKPDRMIRRFVADALERPSAEDVGVDEAVELVTRASEAIGVDATTLDHEIWQYQRAHTER